MIWIIANWKLLLGGAGMLALAIALATTTVARNQWRAAARKSDAALAQVALAQKTADVAARKALADQEARYKEHADVADTNHAAALAAAQSDTDRYIAAHRVPVCAAGGASGRAPAPAQGGVAGVPASLPADSVMVSVGDVRACTDAAQYALDARAWALGL